MPLSSSVLSLPLPLSLLLLFSRSCINFSVCIAFSVPFANVLVSECLWLPANHGPRCPRRPATGSVLSTTWSHLTCTCIPHSRVLLEATRLSACQHKILKCEWVPTHTRLWVHSCCCVTLCAASLCYAPFRSLAALTTLRSIRSVSLAHCTSRRSCAPCHSAPQSRTHNCVCLSTHPHLYTISV